MIKARIKRIELAARVNPADCPACRDRPLQVIVEGDWRQPAPGVVNDVVPASPPDLTPCAMCGAVPNPLVVCYTSEWRTRPAAAPVLAASDGPRFDDSDIDDDDIDGPA